MTQRIMSSGSTGVSLSPYQDDEAPWKPKPRCDASEFNVMYSSLLEALKMEQLAPMECGFVIHRVSSRRLAELRKLFASESFILKVLLTIDLAYQKKGYSSEDDWDFYDRYYDVYFPEEKEDLPQDPTRRRGREPTESIGVNYSSRKQMHMLQRYSPEKCDRLYSIPSPEFYLKLLENVLAAYHLRVSNLHSRNAEGKSQ